MTLNEVPQETIEAAEGTTDWFALFYRRANRYSLLTKEEEVERRVVELRFGLGREEPVSQRETGKRLGISEDSARDVEIRALRRLSHNEDLAALREAA